MPLVVYDSSSEDEGTANKENSSIILKAAPEVDVQINNGSSIVLASTRSMDLTKPQIASVPKRNIITGYAQEEAFSSAVFNQQKRVFDSKSDGFDTERTRKAKRSSKGNPSVLEGDNTYKGPWAEYKNDDSSSEDEYQEEPVEEVEEDVEHTGEKETPSKDLNDIESSEFVGSEEYDYLGRTYMHIPQDLDINLLTDPGSRECFIPKKKIHSWDGHVGGTTRLRFFPKAGHVLLSCGNDSKIKLWSVYKNRELLRVYSGHSRAVKDVDFSNDGKQFLSCSFDRTIKLWDTETGKCLSRFSGNNAIPNTVRFNPLEDKQGEFLAGMSNKKILQFDIRTREVVQEYDHHLGPVNTITFVDSNYRFMSTSDDKTIRIWDWGINAPIKFIADPNQHSMPAVRLHPSGKYVVAESMDNRLLVFGAKDRFRPNRKKEFTGLQCAGYAIGLDFSPDGKYLMSGDSTGSAFFWDWKTGALKSKFKAHTKAVLCVEAHPQETSKVATAGLDGVIHYWD